MRVSPESLHTFSEKHCGNIVMRTQKRCQWKWRNVFTDFYRYATAELRCMCKLNYFCYMFGGIGYHVCMSTWIASSWPGRWIFRARFSDIVVDHSFHNLLGLWFVQQLLHTARNDWHILLTQLLRNVHKYLAAQIMFAFLTNLTESVNKSVSWFKFW